MGDPFLRQSCQVAGAITTGTGTLSASFDKGLLGSGGRVIAAMCLSGAGHGLNDANFGGVNFAIDVGDDDVPNLFSTDILFWDETAANTGATQINFTVGAPSGTTYLACWAGEWTEMDQSNYGYQGNPKSNNGNVDYDASFSWTGSGQDLSLSRGGAGGDNFNYSPAMGLWIVGGKSPIASVTGQSFDADGYVTDGANIWMAVQSTYVNATGQVTATWQLSQSGYYNAANLTFKTLQFPSSPRSAGKLLSLGVG